MSATEDWLYDEGEDQPKKVYVERLNELKKIGDPVVERERESVLRPGAYDLLGRTVVHYEKIVTAYDAGVSMAEMHIFYFIIVLSRMKNMTI